ncbi:polyphosphate:nucleotide phosphotransferase, PPK2 family [Georgenia satyanarayanai]|uniref:Polyphosphate:nucleotide phosphotransferase, PPK2 family n=1 Tax=Georgenia satyanarayanai TaxID=860221 RepID=A0A2Y8ZXQ9_9MICO|nr:PPK2 family polyphosphate kinase [Georgenia satyanarayanai]PYG01962.1 PPK2 family polyphosphate:nucleotide phosphotransferase [Georgenia satyanarayanai]SSA36765.1 polyphosphate:nucleotide phosphotransferase, PPK2 family [Georgenia satyanarayanai]
MTAKNRWSRHPAEILRPGEDFSLSDVDARATPGWQGDKRQGKEFARARGALLSELQERLFAQGRAGGKRSVLLVVQGMDTSGKGGVVRHVIGMVDPQGVVLRAFGRPTDEELSHHYLWRVRKALPTGGQIGVFDRSHYEDVLVPRVQGLIEPDVWEKRYAEINRFEREVVESGTTLLKVGLVISRREQGLRLAERLQRFDKHWKFDPADVDARTRWDDYQQAYADVFARTSTDVAPWYVVPADRKWYARLAVTELLTRALIDLDLSWPKPRWKVETQQRRLAETMEPDAVAEARASEKAVRKKLEQDERAFAAAVAEARH